MKNKMTLDSTTFVDGGFAIPVKLDIEKALLRGIANVAAARNKVSSNTDPAAALDLDQRRRNLKALYAINNMKNNNSKGLKAFLNKAALDFHRSEIMYGDLDGINRGAWSSFDPKEAEFTDAKLFPDIKREYVEEVKRKYGKGEDYQGDLEFIILADEGENNAPVDDVGWGKGCYAQVGEEGKFVILGVFALAVFKPTFGDGRLSERHLIYHSDDGTSDDGINNIYFLPWFCFRITQKYYDESNKEPGVISTFARYLVSKSGLNKDDIGMIFNDRSPVDQGPASGPSVVDTVETTRALADQVKITAEKSMDTISKTKKGVMYAGGVLAAAALVTGMAIKLWKNKSKPKDKPPKRRSKVAGRGRIRKVPNTR